MLLTTLMNFYLLRFRRFRHLLSLSYLFHLLRRQLIFGISVTLRTRDLNPLHAFSSRLEPGLHLHERC